MKLRIVVLRQSPVHLHSPAQRAGLIKHRKSKGQSPSVCNRGIHRLTNGRAFSPCDLKHRASSRWAGLGKLLDLRSEILKTAQLPHSLVRVSNSETYRRYNLGKVARQYRPIACPRTRLISKASIQIGLGPQAEFQKSSLRGATNRNAHSFNHFKRSPASLGTESKILGCTATNRKTATHGRPSFERYRRCRVSHRVQNQAEAEQGG